MRRMVPSILRFQPDPPDGPELRHFLRQAGALIAAAEVGDGQAWSLLRRARAWIAAAQVALDRMIERDGVPRAITDETTAPLRRPSDEDGR